jgi:2-oxo-4-hydroxy-4-carboxy-5-ureidoimidazoline decarboxylase
MAGLDWLNRLPPAAARTELMRCCGSERWTDTLVRLRPFVSEAQLFEAAGREWDALSPREWLDAFSHHPRIGDKEALRSRFAATRLWAAGEQSGVEGAAEDVLDALSEGNRAYESRFGHIFIVCATGKAADEMLALLRARLGNAPEVELRIAAGEQAKITRLRLTKLLADHAEVA